MYDRENGKEAGILSKGHFFVFQVKYDNEIHQNQNKAMHKEWQCVPMRIISPLYLSWHTTSPALTITPKRRTVSVISFLLLLSSNRPFNITNMQRTSKRFMKSVNVYSATNTTAQNCQFWQRLPRCVISPLSPNMKIHVTNIWNGEQRMPKYILSPLSPLSLDKTVGSGKIRMWPNCPGN